MPSTDPTVHSDPAPDDLRASLLASYDEAEKQTADSPAPQDEPASDAAAADNAPPVDAGPPAASTDKGDHPTDPNRYADGTFKKTKTEAAPDKAAPVEKSPSADTAKASTEPASTPASAPPVGWTAAEKAEWSKLSPVAQAAVSRREIEMSRGGQQWSEEKRRYESALSPIAEVCRRRGVPVEQGAQLLAAAQDALDRNPLEGIKRIAAQYGVDLATLAGTQAADGSREAPPQPAPVYRDPRVDAIWNNHVAQEERRAQETVDLVTTFAQSPGHEHFETVAEEIKAILPVIKAGKPGLSHNEALQEAYDRATFANPTTRAAILAQREEAAEAKRVEAAKVRTQNARKAGSSVTGAPSGAPSTQAKDSLRAELEAAFAGA